MVLGCVEGRLQTMEAIFGISQTNGRPDLATKNYWIKNFTERIFLIVFFYMKEPRMESKTF